MLRIPLILLALTILVPLAGATSSGLISANVTVVCPLSLQLSALSVYPKGNTITLSYTINTLSACSISNLKGYFTVSTQPGSIVSNTPETVATVNQIPATYQLAVNTVPLQVGNYTANIVFVQPGLSSSSSAKFQLLQPANLTVTSFTAGPANQSAPIDFFVTLVNNGYYATNSATLNLFITGPEPATITQAVNPLSPGQSENAIMIVNNATSQPGTYTASINATYLSNNAQSTSNSKSLTYTIQQPAPTSKGPTSGGHLPAAPQPIPTFPQISIATAPLYITASSGEVILSVLGVRGATASNDTVSLSVPEGFESMLSLSASSLRVGQSVTKYIQLVFDSRGVPAGTYIVPLNISATSDSGLTTNRTEYFQFVVYAASPNSTSISEQVQLVNSTIAEGTLMIKSLSNRPITNATLYTNLPLGIGSISQIVAYGLPNNISITNMGYTIKWFVPSLPPNQSVYAYYTVVNPKNQVLLASVRNVFSVPTLPTGPSVLRIVNIGIPTFYQDTTTPITVSALYTGTGQQQVTFSMSAPQGVQLYNATSFVNATPNELLTHRFDVATSGYTGTLLFQLQVYTKGASYNYTLPIVVLPTSTTSLNSYPILALIGQNKDAVAGILAIAAIIAIIAALRAYLPKPRHDAETEKRLIRLREHIKRSEDNV